MPATTPRLTKDVIVRRRLFRGDRTDTQSLSTTLNILRTSDVWTTPEERAVVEGQLRRGVLMSTRFAEYQVIPSHVEPDEKVSP